MFSGTKIITMENGNSSPKVLSHSEFKKITGRYFDNTKDYIQFMNADWNAKKLRTGGAIASPDSTGQYNLCVSMIDANASGPMRFNYLIVLGG